LLLTFAGMRRRLRTAISRRTMGMLLLLAAGGLGHRILGTLLGMTVSGIVAVDLWMGAGLASAAGIATPPWMGWSAARFVLGSIAATLRPERAISIFEVTILTWLATFILLYRRAARRQAS